MVIKSFVPLIDIVCLDFSNAQLSTLKQNTRTADFLIVTSANAVYCAPPALLDSINERTFIITMGQATTDALQERMPTLRVNYTAPLGATSESVLQTSYLEQTNVQQKNVCILAGEGGRTVLADTLSERGALIKWVKVYKQEKPVISLDLLLSQLQSQQVCFIATSSRIVENLLSLTNDKAKSWLLKQPLIVVSERIKLQAKEWGFERIALANGAHSSAIVQACENYLF